MNLDIRLPIGGMFGLLGLILVVYGVATQGSEMYAHSLGYNVNVIWGAAMLGFGALMLFFGARKKRTPSA